MHKEIKQIELAQWLESHLDEIYDLIFQIFGHETRSIEFTQRFIRRASRRLQRDRYREHARLWLIRLAVETIQDHYGHFVNSLESGEAAPFGYLRLEEKLALLLRDRLNLSLEEIASAMQLTPGRAGLSLVYAREAIARKLLDLDWEETLHLQERVRRNVELNGEAEYDKVILASSHYISSLPRKRFGAIEHAIRVVKVLPTMSPLGRKWSELPWQYKVAVEGSALAVMGMLALVVFPWVNSRLNTNAIMEGRFADAFTRPYAMPAEEIPLEDEVSTDRLLASAGEGATPAAQLEEEFKDEFASEEFPMGEGEMGQAPVAPSRQNSAIYRLILQSPNPQEIAEHMREVFASEQVRERNSSGRAVPGGVFFDGITTEAAFERIRAEAAKLGITQTYATHQPRRPASNERARVIVWIQQI